MLKADHYPRTARQRFSRTERTAWAIMLLAFAVFCSLASATAYAGYRVITAPAAPTVMAQRVDLVASSIRRVGSTRKEVLADSLTLSIGDRMIVDSGPPGVGARLLTGDAIVGLWPDSTMLVEESDAGKLRLRLEEGQALVDLARPETALIVAADALAHEVELKGPGRYRLRWLSNNGMITAVAERGATSAFEMSTDNGVARIGELMVAAGQRYLVNGSSDWKPARWQLLRDGDFGAYSLDEYLKTLDPDANGRAADTWRLSRQALAEGAKEKSGLFFLNRECPPADVTDGQCRNAMRFARLGRNDKDSHTGMTQEVRADVAAYKSVTLGADIRIDYQSLSKGGADGTECPLLARVDYRNATSDAHIDYCFWAFDDGVTGTTSVLPWIRTTRLDLKTWYHFAVDLRKEIPDLRAVERVTFYSNGHDYDATVANISLVAEGLNSPMRP
jgi:hypothetical protein